MKSICQLLALSKKSDEEEVKKAFRLFAKQHHPDLFPGDELKEMRFKKVTRAYRQWEQKQIEIKAVLAQIRRLGQEKNGSFRESQSYLKGTNLDLFV